MGLRIKDRVILVTGVNWWKAGGIVALFLYGVIGGCHPRAFLPLDGVDLLVHEAGHLVFGMFPEMLAVLGGTLLQLFFPIAFTVYFIRQREYYSASAAFFWVGQNLFNIAMYMRDARAQVLDLISVGGEGDGIIHDWHYLFTRWGVLPYDITIGHITAGIGWLVLLVVLAAGIWFSLDLVFDEPASFSLDESPHAPGTVTNFLDPQE
ncbi:MAG: hypothetical protein ACYDBB_25300 [Armatimonadota bacterium]